MEGYGYDGAQYQPQPQQSPQHQQHQQQTVVIVGQPQASYVQGQPQNIREWSTGLCGCFEDCCGCMYSFFCHPCFMCTLATQMGECCMGPFCCGTLFETSMRTKFRAQYGIKGTVFDDVCCMICCNFCATHQLYREVKNVGYRP